MKTYLARYWAVYGISLAAPAFAACGDSGGTPTDTDETMTSQGPSPTDPTTGSTGDTTSDTTGDSTTALPTTSSASDSQTGSSSTGDPDTTTEPIDDTTTSTTTGGDVCQTILCGNPAVCCGADEECVNAECTPICESGVRCGIDQEICCDAGDVCVGTMCTTPGKDCKDSYDCDPGNYCEGLLGKCLPQPEDLSCQLKPIFDKVDVQLEWAWTADEVTATPLVADVDGDGIPDVIVNTMFAEGVRERGEIVLLDGATGQEKWRITHNPNNNQFGSHGLSTPAVADVDGDGLPDIIYAGRGTGNGTNFQVSPVHAVNGEGEFLWTGRNAQNQVVNHRIVHGSATVVNLDDDPEAEIAFGGLIFDNDGRMVWAQGTHPAQLGTPLNPNNQNPIYTGGLATFADLDDDGYPELITGRDAWKISWSPGDPPNVSVSLFWTNNAGNGNDGWPSVADLDGNGTPEVVLTAWPQIRVIDGATGNLWCGVDPTGFACQNNPGIRTQPIQIGGANLGGPATLADFDGDGRLEAGISVGVAYAVYDFHRPDEVIVKPANDPAPAPGAMYPRWKATIQDATSSSTGSSVFDFQGDGKAEVLFQDECNAYVFSGENGAVQLRITNSSSTVHEYPLVADVDGDGNSEFIVVANLSNPNENASCLAKNPNYATRKGVFLYGAGADNWVPTRRVWTQHTYHVTDADSSGNVPLMEQSNWEVEGLNNFRQNVQGEGVFNAADLTASLSINLNKCSDELVLQATIYNEGSLGVPAGIDVSFFQGSDNTGIKLGSKPTLEPLLTGGSTLVTWTLDAPMEKTSYYVEVDFGENGGIVDECDNTNNGSVVPDAECPAPG